MTVEKTIKDFTIDELIVSIERLKNREKSEIEKGQDERAASFQKSYQNFEKELLSRQTQPEKKNNTDNGTTAADQQPPIEHSPNTESNNNTLNLVVNIPVSTKGNTKRVEDTNKDTHFFDTEEAAKQFQYYNRERLRSKLKSWNKKKHKTKEGKEMMYLVVSYFLAQIEGVINYSAKPEYKEALRKKTYSLGESSNDKTYCFNVEKLRKDFDF
jgi:hypothetical protein